MPSTYDLQSLSLLAFALAVMAVLWTLVVLVAQDAAALDPEGVCAVSCVAYGAPSWELTVDGCVCGAVP